MNGVTAFIGRLEMDFQDREKTAMGPRKINVVMGCYGSRPKLNTPASMGPQLLSAVVLAFDQRRLMRRVQKNRSMH